jgi:type III pantothenate kinase
MNILAVDIGNTNIDIGLFLDATIDPIQSIPGSSKAKLKKAFQDAWSKVPRVATSKEGKRDGVIVACSVKPAWTKMIKDLVKEALDERIYLIGKDIPIQLGSWVDDPTEVGTDRMVAATAAYAVVEGAVAVIDIGTAITIDLVDPNGVFQGGSIFPGFELSAQALNEYTAQLPKVKIERPTEPYGKNTHDAITCGIYYAVIGALQETVRRYAEKLGTWPQTIITGAGAKLIQADCEFIDTYVPNLVVTGIVLTYKDYLEKERELG